MSIAIHCYSQVRMKPKKHSAGRFQAGRVQQTYRFLQVSMTLGSSDHRAVNSRSELCAISESLRDIAGAALRFDDPIGGVLLTWAINGSSEAVNPNDKVVYANDKGSLLWQLVSKSMMSVKIGAVATLLVTDLLWRHQAVNIHHDSIYACNFGSCSDKLEAWPVKVAAIHAFASMK
jgi:hypothetical protein